ncbi:TATA box-binding protein-like protein 1 [Eumeta japonica]|uniref:TATA box-binding protein-like protein 1 n=1 Tax=Eumeta variegata TaxID=151549 RepID=A0A4C1SXD2_EUMVA|nr:TATA box-binding protein-like protein 1 [Eumeta japonica]
MATMIQENGIKELSSGTHRAMLPDHEYCEQPPPAPDEAPVSAPTPDGCPAVEEDTPEIDIMINNVVCSFSVKCHLNLRQIALNGINVEFRRENGMVTMKLRRPYTTASIWSSGRVTCTGATSEEQAKVAARRYARALQKLGFQVRFQNFRVVNVLGTCRMPFGIKIISFSKKYKEAE